MYNLHFGVTCLLHNFNPIALKKAKIAYNFGLSGCNRVNTLLNIFIIQYSCVESGLDNMMGEKLFFLYDS